VRRSTTVCLVSTTWLTYARLNMRMVEQNEFLDIILTADTSSLRRQLEEEPAPIAPPSTATAQEDVNVVKVGLMRPPLLSKNGKRTMESQ